MTVLTRFPPEPNGYLHLGHVKAIMINFLHHSDSATILRMDDTNPESEKKEYVDAIIEDVAWLGLTPCKITYTSDYFDRLYRCAIELLRMDKAYVDFTPPQRMKEERHHGIENEYRKKPVEWNLAEFEAMRKGTYQEGEAVLRLKIDMSNLNHTLRDPVAYRIKYTPHYRTQKEWCIYPSYDYSHGLVDSFENITYSYCTTEFYIRRELYEWPCKTLGYTPVVVHEFGRLNVERNVLSKRKILSLIRDGHVSSMNDPRLLTIRGLRRRGMTPDMLKRIVSGTSFQPIDCEIKSDLLNFTVRDCLDPIAHRYFAVLSPLRLKITNLEAPRLCTHPNHPKHPEMGSHTKTLSSTLYIDRSDYREVETPNYYRLTPNQVVRLRYSDFLRYVGQEDDVLLTELTQPAQPKKVKGNISWVSEADAIPAQFELFSSLLTPEGNYDPASFQSVRGVVEKSILEAIAQGIHAFQFERVGFFRFDRFEGEVPVFVRTVELVNKYE